jgi:hypothetical protein
MLVVWHKWVHSNQDHNFQVIIWIHLPLQLKTSTDLFFSSDLFGQELLCSFEEKHTRLNNY